MKQAIPKEKQTQLARAIPKLAQIRRIFGTITDTSIFAQLGEGAIINGPLLEREDLEAVEYANDARLIFTAKNSGAIDFQKFGPRILSFCTLYHGGQRDYFTAMVEDSEKEMHNYLVRFCLRLIVTLGERGAKQAEVDFLNRELTADDWQFIKDNGCGFLAKTDFGETTEADIKQMARAHIEARDNLDALLVQVWRELITEKGKPEAIDWMRRMFTPADTAMAERLNSAFLTAKQE